MASIDVNPDGLSMGETRNSIAPMLARVMPAVVNITIEGQVATAKDPFRHDEPSNQTQKNQSTPNGGKFVGIGSGVIIDAKNGYIVTNAHVVSEAQSILVRLKDGRRFTAKLIGADNEHDVALLQIHANNLTQLPLADSSNLKVGDFVAAVGSPYDLQQTVTSGIISALHRSNLGIEKFEDFIQTDAPINPGNSGGALVDSQGKFIGMNTAIVAPDHVGNVGIGFSIPSNTVKRVVKQLIQYGKIQRGMVGVQVQTLTPDLAQAFNMPGQKGAVVSMVMPNSPAAKAGLKVGDIITKINDQAIVTADQVHNIVGLMLLGQKINMSIMRHGKQQTITAQSISATQDIALLRQANPYLFGVTLSNVTIGSPQVGSIKGAAVMRVAYSSPASIAGLLPGDIITSVNNTKINNIDDLKKIAEKSKNGLLLHVLRGNGSFYIMIQ